MRDATPAARAEQVVLVAAALTFPCLSLIALGSLYLWEKSLLLWWAFGSFVVVGLVVLWQRWWLHRTLSAGAAFTEEDVASNAGSEAQSNWSAEEREAWIAVRAIARTTEFSQLTSPDGLIEVATSTIEAVAKRLHASSNDAVWQFTLPEALAISERVSRRLGLFVVTHIPFGQRLTVAQILTLYRARQIADVAGKAYDVWRLIRLVNPASAVTHEARERLTKAIYNWGRAQVTRRLVDAYVEEVGRAAIDLYSGRLRRPAVGAPPSINSDGPVQNKAMADQLSVDQPRSAGSFRSRFNSLFRHGKLRRGH